MPFVQIEQSIFEQIIEHARQESPLECCGLLMGESEAITRIRRMRNASQSPVQYSIDPRDLFQFFKELRESTLRHLGIYHSHPTSAASPSSTDVQEAFYPDCTYFIVSLQNPAMPVLRAFSIVDRRVEEKRIQVL